MGLIKPYVTIWNKNHNTQTTINYSQQSLNYFSTKTLINSTKIITMSTFISVQEYHRLKSYHPKKTYRGQETRLPHICFTKYWKTSPHLGYRYNDCNEVSKIIAFENNMEDKFQNRQHTLDKCHCH